MKTIQEELKTAIQNIADNYGVVLGDISVKWIDVRSCDEDRFIINRIDIDNSNIITPVAK